MTESLRRLADQFTKWLAHNGGGFLALQEAIAEYGKGGSKIDRRQLKKIVNGDEGVALTFGQLRTLDAFLASEFRQRLSSLFGTGVLEALVAHDRVRVLLGFSAQREQQASFAADRFVDLGYSRDATPVCQNQQDQRHRDAGLR